MENYERLTIELLDNELSPKGKYEYVRWLIQMHTLYTNAKFSLEDDMEYFGNSHQRHTQAQRTYSILTGLIEYKPDKRNILTRDNVKQIVAEDHGFTNWNHLVDYLCHSNEKTLLNIYIDEVAIMYADAKIKEELELPSLTYHSCDHCGCHCECSDKPCSCCPQKP